MPQPLSSFSVSVRRISLIAAAFGSAALRAATLAPAAAQPAPLSPADLEFFENKVRPILVDNCYKCHSHDADKVKGGLMLDTREGMLAGGDTGPAIAPGKPGDSLMIEAIGYKSDDLKMPPKGQKLKDDQIAALTEWVRRGAPDPRLGVARGSSVVYGGVGRQHWSFLPVQRQSVPAVGNQAWCRTPVDNFVLAKLENAGMKPNPQADKRTLIRRVTFDLTGLPPTEGEVQAFLADTSPDAYAKVVDRLLESPHYGERWARYWLDLARYSDTKGEPDKKVDYDGRYPDAWTYRDYVIDAFNSDKPYNQFIIEQLAADRVLVNEIQQAKKGPVNPAAAMGIQPPPTDGPVVKMAAVTVTARPGEDRNSLAALGFLTLGPQFDGSENDMINDQIDVTTKGFLGLTVTSARCHDHKFDPIPTKDYYSLYGVFANTYDGTGHPELRPLKESQRPVADPIPHPLPTEAAILAYRSKLTTMEAQKEKLEVDKKAALVAINRGGLSAEDKQAKRKELNKNEREEQTRLDREIGDLESKDPGAVPRAMIAIDVPAPKDYPVLVRGERPPTRGRSFPAGSWKFSPGRSARLGRRTAAGSNWPRRSSTRKIR